MNPDALIARVAERQHGLMTHRQCRTAGFTDREIDGRLAGGRWIQVRRRVYLVAGAPPSERQVVLAALLAAGEEALASHLTAARLWGLQLPVPSAIDIVGPRRRLYGVRSHQSVSLVPADRAQLGAIALTSPARTLTDCSGLVRAERLGPIVDDALRRGLVRLEALRACHERVDTGPGRRSTLSMRQVLLARAPGYTAGDSQREADIVVLLARSGLPAPVLGHRVRVGPWTYKLDIAWPEFMVCIEFDGWDTHRTFTAFHRDRNRVRRIISSGWTVLPATSETDLHELIGDVTRLLGATPRMTWTRAN